ncbi:hypothetical protein O1B25_003389 [Vibrio cholerae]|nr:hypothetical protein [Vibrio cholerae]
MMTWKAFKDKWDVTVIVGVLVVLVGVALTIYFNSVSLIVAAVFIATVILIYFRDDKLKNTNCLWKLEYVIDGLVLTPSEEKIIAERESNKVDEPYLTRLIKTSNGRFVLCEFTLKSSFSEPELELSILDEPKAKNACLVIDIEAYRQNFGEPEKC